MKKVDVVYILGKGSPWHNNELLYSLRSIDRFLQNIGNVYIVGSKPRFLNNVIHIPCEDVYSGHESNIIYKILTACDIPKLNEKFLFINDDHFLLRESKAEAFPYYFKGTLEQKIADRKADDEYKLALTNTYLWLKEKKLTTFHYDVHTPIIYSKKEFKRIITALPDWETKEYVVKSLYCNTLKLKGTSIVEDCKLNKRHISVGEIQEFVRDKQCFSIGDRVLADKKGANRPANMKGFLKKLFNQTSRYECY